MHSGHPIPVGQIDWPSLHNLAFCVVRACRWGILITKHRGNYLVHVRCENMAIASSLLAIDDDAVARDGCR